MNWISCRNWRTFQHYDPAKRQPPWIKNYTELMSSDDYLKLSGHERAILHGIWLEYASSRCQLSLDTASQRSHDNFATYSLARRLNLRVTAQHIRTLVNAGFLDIVASKLLAEGYQGASARAHVVEVEVEKEEEQTPNPNPDVDVTDEEERERILTGEGVLQDIPF